MATDGRVTPQAEMIQGRTRHGLISDPNSTTVYAFGGVNESNPHPAGILRSSEQFNQGWSSLPTMPHPRINFNPCIHSRLIFLVGGGHPSMDTFSLSTQSFHDTVSLSIEPAAGIAVVCDGKMMVLSGKMTYWVEGGRVDREEHHQSLLPWSNTAPVVRDGEIYIVAVAGETVTMSVVDGKRGKLIGNREIRGNHVGLP